MTRFRDGKVCNNLATDEIDDHRIQSDYKCKVDCNIQKGRLHTWYCVCVWRCTTTRPTPMTTWPPRPRAPSTQRTWTLTREVNVRSVLYFVSFRFRHTSLHTASRGSSFTCARHLMVITGKRISSTLSPPFPSTSSSSHSSLTSCASSCTSSTTLRAVATLRTSPERRWTPLTTPAYDLKETDVESYTEPLTHPQFSEQGFLEDAECDDTALEEMLHETHRLHVYRPQREGLSVGQPSSSVSERTGRSVGERTGSPVRPTGQELNVANEQNRTLLDRHKEQILAECQAETKKHHLLADYDRRSARKIGEIIESQQEELHYAQAEELQRRDQQLLHEQ